MLRRISISTRVFLLLGLAVALMLGSAGSFALVVGKIKAHVGQDRERLLLDAHKDRIRLATENLAASLGASLAGVDDDARRMDLIRRLTRPVRYGDDLSGYFFVFRSTLSVAQPSRPDLEGTDMGALTDRNGALYVQALRQAAEAGGGFVTYVFNKPGRGDADKLSFAAMIPGSDYWIGTGVYIDNLDAERVQAVEAIDAIFRQDLKGQALAFTAALALLALVGAALARSVARPVLEATHAAERIAQGDLDQRLDDSGQDEAARMMTALNSMASVLKANIKELEAKKSEAEEKACLAEGALRQTEAANREVFRLVGERIGSLQRIANAVAHQLRNPTTIISGFANLLLRKPELRERYLEYLDGIIDAATRIETIAKVVNDYRETRRGEIREAYLPDVVESWRLAAEVKAGALGRHVEWQVYADPIRVRLDPALMSQAMWQILTNAIEALDKEPGMIRLNARRCGNDVQIEVEDNGRGIPATERPYLFDPFYTTKAVGVGMGLPKAERIFQEHQGRLEAHSVLDRGFLMVGVLPQPPQAADAPGMAAPIDVLPPPAVGRLPGPEVLDAGARPSCEAEPGSPATETADVPCQGAKARFAAWRAAQEAPGEAPPGP